MPLLPLSSSGAHQTVDSLQSYFRNALGYIQQFQAQVAGNGNITGEMLLAIVSWLGQAVQSAAAITANQTLTAACVAYVKSQIGDSTFDALGSLTATVAASQSVMTAIVSELPHDANGVLLYQQVSATTGAITQVNFNASQFPNTASAITNWLATVS